MFTSALLSAALILLLWTKLCTILQQQTAGVKRTRVINALYISQDKLLQRSEHTVSIWRI